MRGIRCGPGAENPGAGGGAATRPALRRGRGSGACPSVRAARASRVPNRCRPAGGRDRGDSLHLGHDRAPQGGDADPPESHPLGDALRALPGARRCRTRPARRAGEPRHRPGRGDPHHAAGGRLRAHAARIQGQGLSRSGQPRAHDFHRSGAGDLQFVPARTGLRALRSEPLARRRVRRRAHAGRHHQRSGTKAAAADPGQRLRRHRNHLPHHLHAARPAGEPPGQRRRGGPLRRSARNGR